MSKATFADDEQREHILAGLKWVGLFSDEKVCLPFFPLNVMLNSRLIMLMMKQIIPRGNPLDTLCATLEKKMQFAEGERDLVMYVFTSMP